MENTPIPEAKLERAEAGVIPAEHGWFIVNVADAQAMETKHFGAGTRFENPQTPFPEFGINVRVLQPGQPCALYHRENAQEAFLVLSGECTAIVEGQERPMRKGDLLYAPPNTAHIIVGAGEGPSSVLMVGTRQAEEDLLYPVDEKAARYGASVDQETSDQDTAYGEGGWEMQLKTLPLPW